MAHGISPLMMCAIEHQAEVALNEYRDASRLLLTHPWTMGAEQAYTEAKAALEMCENRRTFYYRTQQFATGRACSI